MNWQPIETAPKDGTPLLFTVAGTELVNRGFWWLEDDTKRGPLVCRELGVPIRANALDAATGASRMSEQTDSWEDYESGPFCRHWSDPSDCVIACENCGHRCPEHAYDSGDRACQVDDCECIAWEEPESSGVPPGGNVE